MTDKLTIALPVYKRTDYIRSALDSAVKQTLPCNILIIDNNSPHDEFKKIADSYNNPLIKYIKTKETVPQDENFNNCFRYAETPWVTVLHDDDQVHFQLSEFADKILKRYGEDVGGISVQSYVGENDWEGIYQKTELTDDIKVVSPCYFYFANFAFPGIILNKDTALKIGGFKSDLHPIADFDFWYRYSKVTNFYFIRQDLAFYRVSPTQSTNNLINDMVNRVYNYRLELFKTESRVNYLTRMAMLLSASANITYFNNMYTNYQLTLNPHLEQNLKKHRRLLNNRFARKVLYTYMDRLSYKK